MFRQIISDTPLTTPMANNTFPNITGSTYQGDVSFTATLRALLYNKLKPGENVYINFSSLSCRASRLSDQSPASILDSTTLAPHLNSGTICVTSLVSGNTDDITAYIDMIERSFMEVCEGYTRIQKITDFLKNSFRALCFVNETTRSVQLFVENMSIQKLHLLECICVAYMPWYFDPKNRLTPDEVALATSLKEKEPDNYLASIEKFASRFDFRTENIKNLLAGIEQVADKIDLEHAEENLELLINDINDLSRRIGDKLRQKRENDIRIAGLRDRIGEEHGNDIMDYFLRNKQMILENVNGGSITFTVNTTLEYFVEDEAKRILTNDRGIFYGDNCDIRGFEKADIKRLLWAIFVDRKLSLKTCASYTFHLGESVRGNSSHEYPIECKESVPNAHIDTHSCLGDYTADFTEMIMSGNNLGVFDTCVVSAKSLHIEESASSKPFIKHIFNGMNGHKFKCIILPDGRNVAAAEAIAYLKEEEAKNGKVD